MPTVGPTFPFDGLRKYTFSAFHSLDPEKIHLDQNINKGLGGTCYGDSGGPTFLTAGGTQYVISVVSTGDAPCKSTSVNERIDTDERARVHRSVARGPIVVTPAADAAPEPRHAARRPRRRARARSPVDRPYTPQLTRRGGGWHPPPWRWCPMGFILDKAKAAAEQAASKAKEEYDDFQLERELSQACNALWQDHVRESGARVERAASCSTDQLQDVVAARGNHDFLRLTLILDQPQAPRELPEHAMPLLVEAGFLAGPRRAVLRP